MARKGKRQTATGQSAPPDSRQVRRTRLGAAGLLILLLALVFLVPRQASPPPSLDQPDAAFLDKIGLVSPDYARTMSGVLLNEPRYQMVVYLDSRPPEGDLAAWASRTATDWRVGAQADNGIALFVFRDARIARAEVGYGLEGQIPDVLVRRLLTDRLAPHFTRGDYQAGFDAFIKGVGEALGGDSALHALWLELGGRPKPGTIRMMLDTASEGIERAPRTIRAAWRTYIEGNAIERVFVLVCSGIFLAILAATVSIGVVTVAQAGKLARRLFSGQQRENVGAGAPADKPPGSAGVAAPSLEPAALRAFEPVFVVFGLFAFCLFSMVLLFALSLAEDALHRKGDFGGAGAYVSWPAPG
jgi:uncharacterized membrane protein YgcG